MSSSKDKLFLTLSGEVWEPKWTLLGWNVGFTQGSVSFKFKWWGMGSKIIALGVEMLGWPKNQSALTLSGEVWEPK